MSFSLNVLEFKSNITVPHGTQSSTTRHHMVHTTVTHSITWYTIQYHTAPHGTQSSTTRHHMVHNTVPHGTQSSTTQHNMVHNPVPHGTQSSATHHHMTHSYHLLSICNLYNFLCVASFLKVSSQMLDDPKRDKLRICLH